MEVDLMKQAGKLSNWAFLIGAIIAVLVGIGNAAGAGFTTNKWIPVILVILGLAVGLLNITVKETVAFLVAAVALLAFGAGGLSSLDTLIPKLGTLLSSSVQAFTFFVGAAVVVVALKEVWALAAKK
jgi:hypothetical protein